MLDTIYASISSPFWWVTVVLGGILLNLVTGWVNFGLGKSANNLLRLWRERSLKQKELRYQRTEAMKEDKDLYNYFIMRVNWYLHMAVVYMMLGVFGAIALLKHYVKYQGAADTLTASGAFLFVGVVILMASANLFRAFDLQEDIRRALQQ
jgi:hypothetical protein